jgi:hypothetical protein
VGEAIKAGNVFVHAIKIHERESAAKNVADYTLSNYF